MHGRSGVSKPASSTWIRRPLTPLTKRDRMPGGRTAASRGAISVIPAFFRVAGATPVGPPPSGPLGIERRRIDLGRGGDLPAAAGRGAEEAGAPAGVAGDAELIDPREQGV